MKNKLKIKLVALSTIMLLSSNFAFAGAGVFLEIINHSTEDYVVEHTSETCWNGSGSIDNLNTIVAAGETKNIYTETNNSGNCNSMFIGDSDGRDASDREVVGRIYDKNHQFWFRLDVNEGRLGYGYLYFHAHVINTINPDDYVTIKDSTDRFHELHGQYKARLTITPDYQIEQSKSDEKLEVWKL